MNTDELINEVEKIKWFHTIDLGNGILTKGVDNSPEKLKTVKMEGHMKGKTVLDIGAWDGFFSFAAERLGASKVVAIDPFMWNGNQWGSKSGFTLARQILDSKVQDIDIREISEVDTLGSFDIVLFLGMFYHLRDPLVVLEKVAKVAREMLILETEMDLRNNDFPMMSFNFDRQVYEDHTNYWFPNQKLIEALLRTVGFKEVRMVHKSNFLWRVGRSCLNRGSSKLSFADRTKMGRAVFHAFK